jgi:hypothetical protein
LHRLRRIGRVRRRVPAGNCADPRGVSRFHRDDPGDIGQAIFRQVGRLSDVCG